MKHTKKIITTAIIIIPLILSGCLIGKRIDITTDGFISDSCYQALLTISADKDEQTLVGRRDSSYMKARTTKIRSMVLDHLADYCVDMKLKKYNINRNRIKIDIEKTKVELKEKLRRYISRGKIHLVFYDEKESFIVAYRIKKTRLRENIDSLIDSVDLGIEE